MGVHRVRAQPDPRRQLGDHVSNDYWQGRADWNELHGIVEHTPSPPPGRCPKHGLYEFTLWGGCPSCEDEDAAAFEAEKVARFDRPFLPTRRPAG